MSHAVGGRWELDQGDQAVTVAVTGPLIVDDVELMRHQPAALTALIDALRL